MTTTACREQGCGICLRGQDLLASVFERDGWREHFFTIKAAPGDAPELGLAALEDCLESAGAHLVELDVFGPAEWLEQSEQACLSYPELRRVPLTRLVCPAGGGWLARAVSGRMPEPVTLEGRMLGFSLHGAESTYCWLGGVTASDLTAGPGAQTRNVLETITRALGGVGMNFGHVDRTWFYLDDILGWYGEFNRVRTAFFEEHRIFEGLMPASTGIGTPNADGAALVAKAHAVLPRDGRPRVRRAESPWQGEALAYGSAFNRAVSVRCGESRALHISGTASIGADGELLHLGSLRDQIRLTLEVVHGILLEAGMDWENAVRGVAYFRDAEDIALWEECREAAGVPPLPVVTSACVVCWTGLLFELELEAAGP